jgi:hypothetical protein
MGNLQTVNGNDRARQWAATFLLTATFCALLINQSLMRGALALPATYDDISYYVDGANLLQKFYENGFAALLEAYLANPPHSPVSTGLAFIGFSLIGTKTWTGPLANSVLFLFFVRAFFSVAAPLPIGQAALLGVALMGFPFVGATILEFRPDMFCSLLTAAGTLFIVLRPHWLDSRRDQFVAGLLLAAALWAKPTVFHLTMFLFGAAMLLAGLQAFWRREFMAWFAAAVMTGGVGVLFSLPYYMFTLSRVIDYIWRTAFGSQASIWVQQRPFKEQVLFYLTGYEGRNSIGSWLYMGMALGAGVLAMLWYSGDRRKFHHAALALAMILLTYVSVTIPEFKGPHGLSFAAIFFIAVALACVTLLSRLQGLLRWGLCLVLVVFSAWQFEWPFTRSHFVVRAEYAASRWAMLRQAFESIGENAIGKVFLLTTSSIYLNYNTLAFEYFVRGLTPPVGVDVQLNGDLEDHRRKINAADIVFALTPEFTEVVPHLPTASSGFRAQVIKLIENSGQFNPPTRIPDPISGGAALIYVRPSEFTNFYGSEGIREAEGPYPNWNLPRVRWGFGQQSTLVVKGRPLSQAKLFLGARAVGLTDQTLIVIVNSRSRLAVGMTYEFAHFQVPFEFDQQGHAEIILRYGIPSENAVLFNTLAVR